MATKTKQIIHNGKRVYVVFVHNPTGRQFTNDRNYRLIVPSARGIDVTIAAERWDNYGGGEWPDWAAELPKEEFTAHWLY